MSQQHAHELVYGIHPLVELLRAKRRKLYTLYTTKPVPKMYHELERLLPKGLQIQYVSRDVLTKLAGTPDHQGVLGYVSPLQLRKKPFDPTKSSLVILLDGVQDTRTAGEIIISAHCAGFDGVIVCKKQG